VGPGTTGVAAEKETPIKAELGVAARGAAPGVAALGVVFAPAGVFDSPVANFDSPEPSWKQAQYLE